MAASEAANRMELTALAQMLASGMRNELVVMMREMFERNAFAERLAYSPDEAAELLGISRKLVHDLLRTGQLGSVKAGRRRLIGKHHLEAFLAGEHSLHGGTEPGERLQNRRLTYGAGALFCAGPADSQPWDENQQ